MSALRPDIFLLFFTTLVDQQFYNFPLFIANGAAMHAIILFLSLGPSLLCCNGQKGSLPDDHPCRLMRNTKKADSADHLICLRDFGQARTSSPVGARIFIPVCISEWQMSTEYTDKKEKESWPKKGERWQTRAYTGNRKNLCHNAQLRQAKKWPAGKLPREKLEKK